MRALSPSADSADLAAVYAYPPGRTWLRANMIESLDGAAQLDKRSGGLGGPADEHLFTVLRGLADAVIVGASTVRVEGYGPVRPREGWAELRAGRPPAPPLAIVSRSLDLDFDAPVFAGAQARTILLTTESAAPERLKAARERADVIVAGEDGLDFPAAMRELAARGHRRLLCEGGPAVLAQMVTAGVLDELSLTLSPKLVGGLPKRILDGPILPAPPEFHMASALEEGGFLFLRYVRKQ